MSASVSQTSGARFINASDAKAEIPLIYNPTTGDFDLATSSDGLLNTANFVWNTGTLSWDKMTQPGGGGGGGGACTIADGADVVEGTLAAAAVTSDAAGTVSGKLRGLVKWAYERMPSSIGQKIMTGSLPVVIASDQSAVSVDASGSVISGFLSVTNFPAVQPVNDNGGSLTVDGTVAVSNFPATQPVSGTVALDAATLAALESISVQNGAGAAAVNIQDGGNSITVDGPLTDAQLRASPVPVSGTVTITDGSGPVTIDGTVAISGTVPVSIAATVTVDQPVVDLVGNAPATASVGVASAVALAANANRKGAAFVNLSVNNISFGLDGNAAVLGSGITLTPFGTWVMDDYTFTTGAIAAIASAAASALAIQEFQ